MSETVANLAKSSAIALLVGGLPPSLALLHLRADIASPEIASIPLFVVLPGIVIRFGNCGLFSLFGQVCWWSLIACVPLEAFTYLYSAWGPVEP
jgi:hypothetical protein